MNTITLSKGGTGEKTVPLSEVQIPDCYKFCLGIVSVAVGRSFAD